MKRLPALGTPEYLEARGWAKALRSISRAWRKAWTPRTPPSPSEWAESGAVVLPSNVAARGVGGRLSFRSRPYWRLPLEWFGTDGVEVIVVEVASQCGKTTLDIAIALFGAEWLAGPGLLLMPSDDHAEDLTRDRLRPIFQASPFGRGLKANDLRLGGVSFAGGGNLNVIGVGSPNALKGRPARWVLFDEYDEALRYGRANGSPLERAKTRTRTYGSLRRIVLTSTPTVETEGIHPEYEKSRRYEWHVPCQHCGTHQALEMSHIHWPRSEDGETSASPDDIVAQDLAWYQCPHCRENWTNADRLRAIAGGRAHCLDPDRPMLQVGLHISVLYSPDVSLSEIAAQFLKSLADPEAMVQFRNEWLAEPRREIVRTSSTDQAHLATLGFAGYDQPAPDWWRSEAIPQAPDFVRGVTWGFDVQGAEVWGLCRGWGDHGENIVLWAGKFAGSDDLEHAAQAFRREWIVQGGEVVRPRRGMMDSGYRTHEVYRICAKTPGLIPSKGRQDGTLPMLMSRVDRQDANRRTVGQTDLAILWTTYWQDQVESSLSAGPGRGRHITHLPCNPPGYLYRHLTAERKVAVNNKRAGTTTYVWRAHDKENHLRDCLVYSTAAAGHAKLLELRPQKAVTESVIEVQPDALPDESAHGATPPPSPAPAKKETALARMLKARAGGSGIQVRKL